MDKKERIFDKRLVAKNLARGIVNEKDFSRFLKELPDLKNKSEEDDIFGGPAAEKQQEG